MSRQLAITSSIESSHITILYMSTPTSVKLSHIAIDGLMLSTDLGLKNTTTN